MTPPIPPAILLVCGCGTSMGLSRLMIHSRSPVVSKLTGSGAGRGDGRSGTRFFAAPSLKKQSHAGTDMRDTSSNVGGRL